MSAHVVRVTCSRREITASSIPELKTLYGLDRLPLAPSWVSVEIKNVSRAVINALRRTLTDEMPGAALSVGSFDSAATTEKLMLPQFVNDRIELMPLRPSAGSLKTSPRWVLDVTNSSEVDRTVYSGDLTLVSGSLATPIFNPTFPLCTLRPGCRIVVRDITVALGYGRVHAKYNVARLTSFRHLDIPRWPDAEMRHPGGLAVDLSDYKESSLLTDPQEHLLLVTIPATGSDPAEVRDVFTRACTCIIDRLKIVLGSLDSPSSFSLNSLGELGEGLVEGTLMVPGESHTLGSLIRKTVYDLTPDVASVLYKVVTHEDRLELRCRHATKDVATVFRTAIERAIATFVSLHDSFAGASF